MKIFDTRDIKAIDEYTIMNEPVLSIDLMERAAKGCSDWIVNQFKAPADRSIKIFTGPGNNGGDGFAVARMLAQKGYSVDVFYLNISPKISPDAQANLERLTREGNASLHLIDSVNDFPEFSKTDVIIDALFGSGLSRSLEGLAGDLVKHINSSGCTVISIDIPSGLFGADNRNNNPDTIIRANATLTFEFPKRSFFFAENEKYTGNWHIIPIQLHKDAILVTKSDFYFIDEHDVRSILKSRKKFSHKGSFGHALLIAGSRGMLGAAILAGRSCMRTGAGLLTSHVPSSGYLAVQTALPESIFSIDPDENVFSMFPETDKYSAIGAGPGIGRSITTVRALEALIKNARKPLVLDADALNILAENSEWMNFIPENTIFTPHPGEFDRLFGSNGTGFERNRRQIELSAEYKIIIVLKGAYTSVTMPDGKCYYNSTGNPGMSTAGSGDVLTGMILSLLAQGYHPETAALAGVYLHGLAGDLALDLQSQESAIASDIIENIGKAFKKITKNETRY